MATRLMGIDAPPGEHNCKLPDIDLLETHSVVLCDECGDRWKVAPALQGFDAIMATLTLQPTGRAWVRYMGKVGEAEARGVKAAKYERERRPV